ncbi:MAG: aldehyde dehydrogenase family protein [Pseudomonadota bacterium]
MASTTKEPNLNLPAHLIGGSWIRSDGAREVALANPGTGEARRPLLVGGEKIVRGAVAAAVTAREAGWGEEPPAARIQYLDRLIEAIEARRERFAALISEEVGAPIDFARTHQVQTALGHLAAIRAAALSHSADTPVSPDRPSDRVRYEPVGVAGLITPWNWPLNQIALKVGAALVAGCPMVLKPSELAPQTAMLFGICMEASGLPAGVFNLALGDGQTGAELAAHPDIDVVSFTGSTRAGRSVARSAAERMARVTLELGGKSPNLLFADCDLETAIRQGVAHCFRNAGQSCNAASRMLVERSVYEDAVTLAAAAAEATTVGLPDAPGPHLGPQINARQYDRVQELIETGQWDGARLVAGGPGRPEVVARGFFSRPTVFADVTPEMRLFREEIFGPVLSITPFDTEDEAVRLANDTEYGLAAFVQTNDPVLADRVSKRLRAGMVQVNGKSRAPGAPFGGVKASGMGREAGIWGIRAFQEIKSITGAELHLG